MRSVHHEQTRHEEYAHCCCALRLSTLHCAKAPTKKKRKLQETINTEKTIKNMRNLKNLKRATWHIGPPFPCEVTVSLVGLPQHVSVQVRVLASHFQCDELRRRGASRLTSVLESCGTPRCLSTCHSLSVLGGCWGWWWVREHAGKELRVRVESSPILCTLSERQLQDSDFVCNQNQQGAAKLMQQDLNPA